jgi:hypothetical protein
LVIEKNISVLLDLSRGDPVGTREVRSSSKKKNFKPQKKR